MALDTIRKLAYLCTGLPGFMVYHAVSGDTGFGLSSLLLKRLSVDFGGKAKVFHSTLPCHGLGLKHTEVAAMNNNEVIHDICYWNLNIERPAYTNFNPKRAFVHWYVSAGMEEDE